MVVRLAKTFGKGLDLADGGVLIYQLIEPVLAGGAPLPDLRLYGAEASG
jgi:hypothetical protein